MGFRYEPRQYKLVFEDEDIKGLEVITGSVTLAEYNATEGDEALGKLFAEKLISWNLEDDNGAVPATYDALQKQDIALVRAVLVAWFRELTGVSRPLPQNSNATRQSEEASLGMGSLSPSRPN